MLLVRLLTHTSFATSSGWTKTRETIIDTGAPVSLIPFSVWSETDYRLLAPNDLGLTIGGEHVRVKLAEVNVCLHDDHAISPPLTIKAHLLPDDAHPLLLGFEDVLTDLRLVSDYAAQVAYLEWPSPSSGAE